jgi:hypothetical protein
MANRQERFGLPRERSTPPTGAETPR